MPIISKVSANRISKITLPEESVQTSLIGIESSLNHFKQFYLGESATEPTLKLDGTALTGGELYTNSVDDKLYYYSDSTWKTTAEMEDGSITNEKLASDSVSGNNIIDGVVTNEKLAADVFSTDRTWSGSQRSEVVVDADMSFDMNAGQNFSCTLSQSRTLTFTNIVAGQSGFILVVNGNNYTISKDSAVKCGDSVLSNISNTGTYLLSYWSNGTNVYVTSSGVMN